MSSISDLPRGGQSSGQPDDHYPGALPDLPGIHQMCPRCVPTDRPMVWRAGWRSPLVIGCLRHGLLLQDECPSCRLGLVTDEPPALVAVGEPTCGNRSGLGRCGQKLADVPARALTAEEIAFSEWMDEVLEGRAQTFYEAVDRPAHEALHSLMATLRLAQYCATRDMDLASDADRRDMVDMFGHNEFRCVLLAAAFKAMTGEPRLACGWFASILPDQTRDEPYHRWLEEFVPFDEHLATVLVAAMRYKFAPRREDSSRQAGVGSRLSQAERSWQGRT